MKTEDEFGIPHPPMLDRAFIFPSHVKFFIGQIEKGDASAHLHLQAYVEFDHVENGMSMVECKREMKLFFNSAGGNQANAVHIEVARGTREQQIAYCTKEATRVNSEGNQLKYEKAGTADETQYKERAKRGREHNTIALYARLEKNALCGAAQPVFATLQELLKELAAAENEDEKKALSGQIMRIEQRMNVFTSYCATMTANVAKTKLVKRNIQVVVFFGTAGTGKTYRAWQQYGRSMYKKEGYQHFWDGYNDEEVLLLDDFKGEVGHKAVITVDLLQQICEGWQFKLDIKGKSPMMAKWKIVVITTNLRFEEWFAYWVGVPPRVVDSIRSRIPLSCWVEVVGEDRRPAQHQQHVFVPLEIVEE